MGPLYKEPRKCGTISNLSGECTSDSHVQIFGTGAENLYALKRIMIYSTYILGSVSVSKFEQILVVGDLGIDAKRSGSLSLSAC